MIKLNRPREGSCCSSASASEPLYHMQSLMISGKKLKEVLKTIVEQFYLLSRIRSLLFL